MSKRKHDELDPEGPTTQITRQEDKEAATSNQLYPLMQTEQVAQHMLDWLTFGNIDQARRMRISDKLLGQTPQFHGVVHLTNGDDARRNDEERLKDIKNLLNKGLALVYWTDGSCYEGALGASVVWRDGEAENSQEITLGRWTGDNNDAELHAIVCALGRAIEDVEAGKKLDLVRIYTDCHRVLEHLKIGQLWYLGPLLVQKTALEALYTRTEWLSTRGVVVELHWVKAHMASAGNRDANKIAKAASQKAYRDSLLHNSPKAKPKYIEAQSVPSLWTETGQDWADKWRFRANRAFYEYWCDPTLKPLMANALESRQTPDYNKFKSVGRDIATSFNLECMERMVDSMTSEINKLEKKMMVSDNHEAPTGVVEEVEWLKRWRKEWQEKAEALRPAKRQKRESSEEGEIVEGEDKDVVGEYVGAADPQTIEELIRSLV